MRLDRCKLDNNYYAKVDNIKIYVDMISKCVKILNISNISVQNIKRIIHYASKQHLGKVICNCDIESSKNFYEAGFKLEGKISGYFKGEDALCMSYFISVAREVCSNFIQKESLIKECLNSKNTFKHTSNHLEYKIRSATKNDIKDMIKLFSTVFPTLSSPSCNEKFLEQNMNKKVIYKIAVCGEQIISIASADMDKENLTAEITDCATYPEYRCKGILSAIIYSLECDLRSKGFLTLYSLSRAVNPSINYALSKHNYTYAGRLVNNCNVCGAFEDMNIWVKNINRRYNTWVI